MSSGGCGKHPTNVAPVNKLTCGLAGGTVSEATWADFNDPEREQYRAEQQEAADDKEREDKAKADMNTHLHFEQKRRR